MLNLFGFRSISVAAFLLPSLVASPARTGSIRGIIRDVETRAAIPYAHTVVVEIPRATLVGPDGGFLIEDLPPGTFTLRASYQSCWESGVETVVVAADSVTVVELFLMRKWPYYAVGERVEGPSQARMADPLRPFTVDVPRGWFAKAANFSVMHYRDVFAVVNNLSDSVRVTDKKIPNGWTNSLETVAEQLPPGTVYVDFAHFEGPGRSAAYGPGREDSFEKELASFLRNPSTKSTPALDTYELDFMKWGSHWDVRVYCRKPYNVEDREHAFKMLASLRFFERPVVNFAQAVGVAMKHLPAFAQPVDTRADSSDACCFGGDAWLANGGRYGHRETRIEKTDDGFEVVFVLYEDGNGEKRKGEWHYLVRWDGTVNSR